MKKLLLSSVTLLLFSFSILLFDISCKKESIAQSNPTDTIPKSLGVLVFMSPEFPNEIWKCNYDGSNQTKINIDFITDVYQLDRDNISVSPDGKKIFLGVEIDNQYWVCSINIDGTGFTKVFSKGIAKGRFCAI